MTNDGLVKILEGHSDGVLCAAFSPCGKFLATGSEDNTVKLWSLPDGVNTKTIEAQAGNIHGLAFSPDCGRLAAAGWDKVAKVWQVADGSLVKTLAGHDSCVNRVCFSPDGKTIATSSNDASLKLWDAGGELLKTIKPNLGDIKALSFSPDGKVLALGGVGLQLFSMEELALLKDNDNYVYGVKDLSFSPDGKLLAAALGMEKKMELWSLATLSLSGTIKDSDWINCAAFTPWGKTIVTGGSAVKVWDAQNGITIKAFEGHSDEIYSVCVSPDGQHIASASNDKTARLWKT